MWKQQEATNLLTRFILSLVLTAHLLDSARALSDKRLCADENCKEIISLGTGLINYQPGEKGMVAFGKNSNIRIKSKSAGKDPSLWGIEVGGREGYAPKKFIRETKVIKGEKLLKYIVDVEQSLASSEKQFDEEHIVETKTTAPLNHTPSESTENALKMITSEKLTSGSLPVATPVLPQIVDGTEIPNYVNEVDVNRINENNINIPNKLQMKPVTSNQHGEAEDTQPEPEASESVENNEEVSISDNGDEIAQSSGKAEVRSSSSSDAAIKRDSVGATQLDAMAKAETAQMAEVLEDSQHSSVNAKDLNFDIVAKKNSTNSAKNQNPPKKDDAVLESSQQESVAEEVIKGSMFNSTTGNVDIKNDNSIATEEDDTPNATKHTEKETVNSVLFQKPPVVTENLKEDAPEIDTFNEKDTVYSVEKQNPAIQSEIMKDNMQRNSPENNANKMKVISDRDHGDNEGKRDNSKNVKDEGEPLNSWTLDELSADTEPIINFENAEDITKDSSTNQHDEAHNVDFKNEDLPGDKSETDNKARINNGLNSLTEKINDIFSDEENLVVQQHDTKESATESNTDKVYNPEDSPKMPTIRLNEENIMELGDFPPKYAPSESKIDDITANNIVVESETGNNIKESEEAIVDDDSSKEYIMSEKHNNEFELKQSKIDDEIDSMSSIPQKTVKISVKIPNRVENVKTSSDYVTNTEEDYLNTTPSVLNQLPTQTEINPTTYDRNDHSTPLSKKNDNFSYEEVTQINSLPNEIYGQQTEDLKTTIVSSLERQTTGSYNTNPTSSSDSVSQSVPNKNEHEVLSSSTPIDDIEITGSYNTNPSISSESVSQPVPNKNEHEVVLPSSTPIDDIEVKENKGLFATIMSTVNNVLSMNKKNKRNEFDGDGSELDRILFSKESNMAQKHEKFKPENSFQYCKNIGPDGDCPETAKIHEPSASHFHQTSSMADISDGLTFDSFLTSMAAKILEMSRLLACLVIVAAATLFFVFGYYCFCNTSREGALLSKLNQLESSFLASHKENAILKHNLMATRQKLVSIEDNSFGSNDMVISLKKDLEEELMEKARLQEQITVLQKELENAADAGIELNKIVSELLSNQAGDESIISSVEELQKQLNEQQNIIYEINASLAEKSRENNELQLMIAEQNARYETELASVQRDNDELEQEKGNLLTKLDEMKNDFDKDIIAALEGKNMEIKRLQNEIIDLTNKWENEHTKWQTSVAKIEALEECLKNIRKDPNLKITEVIDVAYVKAQLIEIQQKYKTLKEKHETELDCRKLAESQLEVVSAEVEKLKQDFNKSEKDKLEAQTRLEVLSNYFKDKENQLQKELSLKEAMWLNQQGETTTTVDRLTAMQEEIQSLKSQNDSLRAEIEAQVAAHKAQTGTLENRAHETWLAARQSDRRYEEARAEATALRRKLTALAGGNVNDVNKPTAASTVLGDELTQVPSPIHMESPGSPMLGRMPPPPFLPRPFMGPPPPFMGMPPPPPFVPPGEMRPAPLGRIMSPPPQRSGRFSPQPLDYDNFLDYDSNNTWHRHTYSPPPRTYRSLSPADSRYDYGTERDLISTYDTETDFSPPPSPRESRRRVDNKSDRIDSNAKISYGSAKNFNSSNKGPLSSGSEKSYNTPVHNENKTRKGKATGGGKSLV